MTQRLIQCFVRGDILSVELAEVDELGRQIGGTVVVEAEVSSDLRSALDAQVQAAQDAQTTVIADAKDAKQQNPNAAVVVVADLKPKR